jgi:CSLREA domain-containing protein
MSERSFRRDRERRIATAKRREALRKRRIGLVGGIAAGAFVLAPQAAHAVDFEVNTLNDGAPDPSPGACTIDADGCTLREAINDSNVSGTDDNITFLAGLTGTITLDQGPLVVQKNSPNSTTITGPGADDIYVDGNGASLVFDAADTGTGLTISGLTLGNGYDEPAGGLYVQEGEDVTLSDSTVTGNTATGARDGSKYIFFGGGGITNRGELLVEDTLITNNYADSYIPDMGPPFPYGGGGGINNLGDLTVTGSTIDENGSSSLGGGILSGISKYPSSMSISDTTISDNGAPYGGGIAGFDFITSVGSSHNQITNSTITGNFAETGGGVGFKYLGGSRHWQISHSTIEDNTAFDDGGGLGFGNVAGTFELLDSTVSGNDSYDHGGGAYVSSSAQKYQDGLQFNNSTIASNTASEDGGGLYLEYADEYDAPAAIPLFSTIVANNTSSAGLNDLAEGIDIDPSEGAFDLSFSLVRAPGNATITETPPGSNLLGVDPQLGPLANNGGLTETHLPSINSPAVDRGSAPGNLTTDQRGDARTVDTGAPNANDGTDIGSVELATGLPFPPAPPAAGGGTKVGTLKKKHKKRRRVIRTKNKVAKVRITFRSNNTGVTFRCSVDGGSFVPCTSPFVTKLRSGPGKGKNHNIAIQQVDAAGNQVGNVRVFKFRVVLKD